MLKFVGPKALDSRECFERLELLERLELIRRGLWGALRPYPIVSGGQTCGSEAELPGSDL